MWLFGQIAASEVSQLLEGGEDGSVFLASTAQEMWETL